MIEMTCTGCKKIFLVTESEFEKHETDGSIDLCPTCNDEELKKEQPPKLCWEYKTLDLSNIIINKITDNLNIQGKNGWEMMHVYGSHAFFKRAYFKDLNDAN